MREFFYDFNINIISKLILFALLVSLLTYLLIEKNWYFTPILTFLLVIATFWNLLHNIKKRDREFKDFVESIKQRDFLHGYNTSAKGKFKKQLSDAYDIILSQFKRINIEKEAHYQFLNIVNEQTGAAIICITSNGDVRLINPSAKSLFIKPNIRNIRDIKNIQPVLYNIINSVTPIQNKVIKINSGNSLIDMSISIKEFVIDKEYLKLIHIQNIHSELEEKEIESWQKLIRVLTHEILNSLTPVVSLTKATAKLLQNPSGLIKEIEHINNEDIEDVYKSIITVQERSGNLIKFIDAFKSISKLPSPQIVDINLYKVFNRMHHLLEPEFLKRNIDFTYKTDTNYLRADIEMFEQIIINILLNAMDALENIPIPTINLRSFIKDNRLLITVIDNGIGIDDKEQSQIFIPFFTTKRNGSGIGLSLVKQIMYLHKGSVEIQSKVGAGSTLILSFPN